MYGKNRQLMTIQCAICKKHVALRVDPQDVARYLYGGVYVQHAMPYLDSGERELLLTATCRDCYELLCPSDKLAYS